jgi:hypothetical protein
LPKNISKKKRSVQMGKNNINKSISPKAKEIAKSKTPRKAQTNSPSEDKKFMRECLCNRKH